MMASIGNKGQMLIIRMIYVFMGLIALYFAYQILSPVLTQSASGQSDTIQVLEALFIPAIIFFFIIYMFKQFQKGENE